MDGVKVCKHCKAEFVTSDKPRGWMANHSRWCEKNPKKYTGRKAWNSGLTKKDNASLQKMSKSISKAHKNGKYDHVDHSNWGGNKNWKEDTRHKMSESARKSTHRRLQRKIVEYNGVLFDSTWEIRLAKKLDEKGIIWIRPEPIKYTDVKGVTRNYFPDFYLPEYDIYLDPKNPQAYKVQIEKIQCLKSQYKNIVFLCSISEIESFAPVLALPSKQ